MSKNSSTVRKTHHQKHFTVAEETGDNLLRSDFSSNNFRFIWLWFKDPHGGLLFCFGPIRKDL